MDVDDAAENEESEDVVKTLIQATTYEITHHDKKEVVELLKEVVMNPKNLTKNPNFGFFVFWLKMKFNLSSLCF